MGGAQIDKKVHTDKWSRADKINALIAAIALLAALGPYVERVVHDIWKTPHSTITYATWTNSKTKVRGPCSTLLTAAGTADRIPVSDDLWLVARSKAGPWYPLTRITSRAGTWIVENTITTTQFVRFRDIDVLLVSNATDGRFIDARDRRAGAAYLYPRFDNRPPNSQILFDRQLLGNGTILCAPPGPYIPSPGVSGGVPAPEPT